MSLFKNILRTINYVTYSRKKYWMEWGAINLLIKEEAAIRMSLDSGFRGNDKPPLFYNSMGR